MFIFQVTKSSGQPVSYVVLAPAAEQTMRSNLDACNYISSTDMKATFREYGVSKADRKTMASLHKSLTASGSRVVAILDTGSGVKVKEAEINNYNSLVRKWNGLMAKYKISDWAFPEAVYVSSKPTDEIVVTAERTNEIISNSYFYVESEPKDHGKVKTGPGPGSKEFGRYLDVIKGGNLPSELEDRNDPHAQELALSLVIEAINSGRKKEAAFLIGQYLGVLGPASSQNPGMFAEVNDFLNANPDAKGMALSSSLDTESFISFVKLIGKGVSSEMQNEYESKKDYYDAIPSVNTKEGLGREDVIAVNTFLRMAWESAKKQGMDLGDRMKTATRDYMEEIKGTYNPVSIVWSTIKYAGSIFLSGAEQWAGAFGLKSTYDYFRGKNGLREVSGNPLADIYNVSISGNTAKMDWAMNVLFFAAPEMKGVAIEVKAAFTGFASRFGTDAALKTFGNLVDGYVAKGLTREIAMQEAAKFMQSNLGSVSGSYFEMCGNLSRLGKHFAFDDGHFLFSAKNRLLQYGVTDAMGNAGIKAHFCIPPSARGNYQFVEGIYVDLMNLWKDSGGKFGFKYMDGMSGSQFGKDFTIYFSDIETYKSYAPKINALIDQRMAPYGGYGNLTFEEFAGVSTGRTNMANEIPYSGTNGYLRFAVRSFNDESVFIRPQYVQSLVESEAFSKEFVDGMVNSNFLKPIYDNYGNAVLYEIDGNAARNLANRQRNVFLNRAAWDMQAFTYDKIGEGFRVVR